MFGLLFNFIIGTENMQFYFKGQVLILFQVVQAYLHLANICLKILKILHNAILPLIHLKGYCRIQWLQHLWNYENMFETGKVRANGC